MSSAGQRKRLRDDSYYTPPWCVRALLGVGEYAGQAPPELPVSGASAVMDPCAGDGQILRELRRHWPKSTLIANELRREELAGLKTLVGVDGLAFSGDAREVLAPGAFCGWIITNPPFGISGDLVPKMIEAIKPWDAGYRTGVACLLRCSWLYPAARAHVPMPSAVIGLGRRPSFALKCRGGCGDLCSWTAYQTGGMCPHCGEGRLERATDSASYAWYIWRSTPAEQTVFRVARAAR